MRSLIAFTLSTALVRGTLAQVKFTQPDINRPLNLNSSAITIAWTVEPGSQEAREYPLVDIWWEAPSGPGGGTTFGWAIVENYTHSVGTNQFVWDATEQRDALLAYNNTIAAGKSTHFELRFHGESGRRGSGIISEKYAVAGDQLISTAGARVRSRRGAMVLGVAAGSGVVLLLL